MKHIVMFSGGLASFFAAKRVAAKHGTDDLLLVFADTMMEDEDLYRFLDEAAANVGGTLVRLADGRDPWQVFKDKRYIGNHRVDHCSHYLKRRVTRMWLKENHDPDDCIIYLGFTWMEDHRVVKSKHHWLPWQVEAPMCEPPYVFPHEMLDLCRAEGIEPPRLYAMGFSHNNCGGFCIKAGLGHFYKLLKLMPERYAYHEAKEAELAAYFGKNVTILRDRNKGNPVPMSLREFRERIESGGQCDMFDLGGCGCMSPDDEEDDATA